MKLLFFPICILLSLSSLGQKQNISINYKPSFTYFGKQNQSFANSYFESRNGRNTFHNTVNILYNCQLNSKFSLSSGLEYSEQGQSIDLKSSWIGGRTFAVELNYLRIPLTLSYDFLSSRKNKLSLYSGLSVGFVIKRKDNYQNVIIEAILLPPAEKRYKDYDWGIPFGVTFQKNISKTIFANLGAEYLLGLTNSFSENSASKFGVLSEFANSKQSRAALNIGIGLRLTK